MCRGNGGTRLADLAAALESNDTLPNHAPIIFATYNIRNGRNSRLEMALRAAREMSLDFGLLTEAKMTDGIYTRSCEGYAVVATDATSPHQGGVALFYRESEFWQIESVVKHGPNVVSFELVTGWCRIPVVGGYIPPSDQSTLPHMIAAMDRFRTHRSGKRMIVFGDFNVDLSDPNQDTRGSEIIDAFTTHGLEDLLLHFKPRERYSHRQTWWQDRGGFTIRSRCDYILGSDRRMFSNVYLKDPRCFTSDHYMVVGRITSATRSQNCSYLRSRTRYPLGPPRGGPLTQVDSIFQELKKSVAPPPPRKRNYRSWISDNTWKLVDARAALRRASPSDRAAFRQKDREVKAAIKADRTKRVDNAAEAIDTLLMDNNVQGAWTRAKAWYSHAGDRPVAPSKADLQQVSEEYRDLYRKVDPPGDPIPILVAPFDICDDVPQEAEIEEAVKRCKSGKAPGPTGMRAEDLKAWLYAARRQESPDATNWNLLVTLVQECFRTGALPEELPRSILVLLPKDSGGFRGIGLLEIIWKLISSIIDVRLKTSIEFHDCLHGFLAKRGTGTATIEAKLMQQLAAMDQVPLFEVFLDLKKAYDTLDRGRMLQILEAYGVGPRVLALLRTFWDQQKVVARQGRYYGDPFDADRGVTQGDIPSPTEFNIICDAIIRAWLNVVCDDGAVAVSGFGTHVSEKGVFFYADDGLLGSRDAEWLQQALDVLVDLFMRLGLYTNTTKTVTMTCTPGYIRTHQSDTTYGRRIGGGGLSYRERQRRRVECPECGKSMAEGSLPQHSLSQHGIVSFPPAAAGVPQPPPENYRISFPKTAKRRVCPVDDCGYFAPSHVAMRTHFAHRHPTDGIVILEEGTTPLPRCELCDMFVGHFAIGKGHQRTAMCKKLADAKRRRHALEDVRRAEEIVFTACGQPLERVRVFKYLGRVLSDVDSDWPAVYANLAKARKRWGMFSRVLRRENCRPKVAAMFYKATVQAVLLFGSETWVLTPPMLKALEGFHHRVARQLTGKVGRYLPREDRWVYPPIDEVLAEAGLFKLEVYIRRRQNRIVDYVSTRPIMDHCWGKERLGGSSKWATWWDYVEDGEETSDIVD